MKPSTPSPSSEYLSKLAHVLVWAIPICVGFLAAMIWQGLVIGWSCAMQWLERT